MCGIFFTINTQTNKYCDGISKFKTNIKNRGPDSFNEKTIHTTNHTLFFAASVLWLQGNSITEQPLETEHSIFIYNGDIFEGLENNLRLSKGDTTLLLDLLENSNCLPKDLSKIHGPYSFVYYDKRKNKLYFGRDIFGRRSLLLGKKQTVDGFILTSVAKNIVGYDFIELPSLGTFCFDLNDNCFTVLPWQCVNKNFNVKFDEVKNFLNVNIDIRNEWNGGFIKNNEFIEPNELNLGIFNEKKFDVLLENPNWKTNVIKLKNLLENAIEKRISNQPKYCKFCINEKKSCNHSTVGVLFSGGVDCAILSLLADKFVEKNRSIDLINVAFDEAKNYETPDRITSIETLKELQKCSPDRNWNYLKINIAKNELDYERNNHISDLIYPLNTILDDSLGCALWFASKAQKNDSSSSSARVLLVGMGADELFGGYTRHRTSFRRGSWRALHDVLNDDWENLPYRNLARDDRVVSDHGRQLRTPYLDENVVDFVRSLNCWEKTCPSPDLPQGFGEKLLLRSLCYYLGLTGAASLKKRALQFGSRIANSKENAQDVSSRLCK